MANRIADDFDAIAARLRQIEGRKSKAEDPMATGSSGYTSSSGIRALMCGNCGGTGWVHSFEVISRQYETTLCSQCRNPNGNPNPLP